MREDHRTKASGLRSVASHCLVSLLVGGFLVGSVAQEGWRYKDTRTPVEQRVDDLLKRMTLEEKLAQLRCDFGEGVWGGPVKTTGFGHIAPILRGFRSRESAERANEIQKMAQSSRLGIPVIIHDEALHGLIGNGCTSFPQAIALAATWNPDMMGRVATAIATETKARGVRQVLSPVVNVVRDARWGRVEETYGEDPLLSTRMAVAFIKPFEQIGVVTTPKHYVANVWDGGRDSHSVQISERSLRDTYFPPFRAAFQEAGARSVMAAYGSLNGYPCSCNKWLLTDVLRKEWGFRGYVVSDYGSIGGILDFHHTAADKEEAVAQALNAGMDVEYPGIYIFGDSLRDAVTGGKVKMETLDEAVRRVLRVKFEIGLFDDPFVDPSRAEQLVNSSEHRNLALEAARQSVVLLKNEDFTLPLKKSLKTIAVIGTLAQGPIRLGGYSGNPGRSLSVIDGIKAKLPEADVIYAKGCDFSRAHVLPPIASESLVPEGGGFGIQGLRGEYFDNMTLSGEPVLVRIDPQVNFNWDQGPPDKKVPAERFSVRWTGYLMPKETGDFQFSVTSDDGFRLFLDGKLVAEAWTDRAATTNLIPVRLEAGKMVGVKLEYYENIGFASCSLGWSADNESVRELQEAVAAAKQAQAAIVVAGIIEGEGQDRAYLDLPGKQEQLIKAVAATGTPTVVILIAGAPITMENWLEDVAAIVDAWYPGQEGGTAIADVLFGDYNPAGRLPISFPRTVGQCPIYYNMEPSGRGYDYIDSSGMPRFPFGHGLSYTSFGYSGLTITPERGKADTAFVVSFQLENTGKVAGDEVSQLYIRDLVSTIVRPLKELRDFVRVTLRPGEKKLVSFRLASSDLAFLDDALRPKVEPGVFEVMIGASSEDIRLRGRLEVVK